MSSEVCPTTNYRIKLHGDHLPTRIDLALVKALPEFSRRKIRRYLDNGGVYVNRKRVRVASRLVHHRDVVEIFPANPAPCPELSPNALIYTCPQVLVVNKPAGVPCQPTRQHATNHIAKLTATLLPAGERLRVVHRLDLETSGATILARNLQTARYLAHQFKSREISKEYLALCAGVPAWETHEERGYLTPIGKDLGIVSAVDSAHPHARPAVTEFVVLARSTVYPVSLVLCKPVTGRSHQIRAHLQKLGIPVLGDKRYGDQLLPPEIRKFADTHHLLHAQRVRFRMSPETAPITADARIPKNFQKLLGILSLTTLTLSRV